MFTIAIGLLCFGIGSMLTFAAMRAEERANKKRLSGASAPNQETIWQWYLNARDLCQQREKELADCRVRIHNQRIEIIRLLAKVEKFPVLKDVVYENDIPVSP